MLLDYTASFQLSRVTMGTHQIPSSKKSLLAKKFAAQNDSMKGSTDLLSFGFSTISQAIVFSRKNTYLNVTGFHDTFIDKNLLNSVHTISSSSFLLSRPKPSTAWFSLKILKPPNNPFCPLHHFPKKPSNVYAKSAL